MRRLHLPYGIFAISGLLLAVGLSACSPEPIVGEYVCECPNDQGCTFSGACLDACVADDDCGTCGLCQSGLCVRTAECELILRITPTVIVLNAGESADVNITLTRGDGYDEEVRFSLHGDVPPGLTATFDPAVTDGTTSTLTLDAAMTTPTVVVDVIVRTSGPGQMSRVPLSLSITGAPSGFQLTGPSEPLSISPGGALDVPLDIARFGGNIEAITFSLEETTGDFVAEFSPQPALSTDPSAVVTLWASTDATLGDGSVIIKGETPTTYVSRVTIDFDVVALSLSGRVVDADGSPASGVTVALAHQFDAADTATTDTDGAFSFDTATAPYDLTVVAADGLEVVEVQNLTTAEPVIAMQEAANGPTFGWIHAGTITGTVSRSDSLDVTETFDYPLTADQRIAVSGGGTSLGPVYSDSSGSVANDLTWFGPIDQTVDLVALEYERTTPLSYGAWGTSAAPVDLSADSTTPFDIELTTPITPMTINLSWDPADYGGGNQSGMLLSFDLGGAHFLAGITGDDIWRTESSPTAFTVPAERAILFVEAKRRAKIPDTNVGEFRATYIEPVTPVSEPVDLTVAFPTDIPFYQFGPADDPVTEISRRPVFSWSTVTGAAIHIIHLRPDGVASGRTYSIVLPGSVTTWQLPDYGLLAADLIFDQAYAWSVTALVAAPYRTDDFVDSDSGGFGSLLFSGRPSRLYDSGEFRFHTYACAVTAGGTETCDGLDNDCNEIIDDIADVGNECTADNPSATHVLGWRCRGACEVDACDAGYLDDDADPGTGCEASCTATGAETCDGVDNDCNGMIDDGFDVGQACGTGDCEGGLLECLGDGTGTRCSTEAGGSDDLTSSEICDNQDNDCDGTIDNGLTSACYCLDGLLPPLPLEKCSEANDTVDHDCNGLVNDDCCGNGSLDTSEECEDKDLAYKSCEDFGFGGGYLRCDPDYCAIDTSNCLDNPVPGLIISEVYYDHPSTDTGHEWVEIYNPTAATVDLTASPHALACAGSDYIDSLSSLLQLIGSIPAGGCFVVGGPTLNNGLGAYDQAVTFSPAIQNPGSGQADGVALFNLPSTSVTNDSVPIDAVIYGDANTNHLIDETGGQSPVDVADGVGGESIERTASGWRIQVAPTPGDCTHVNQ